MRRQLSRLENSPYDSGKSVLAPGRLESYEGASAPNPKFAHIVPRVRLRVQRGTRIIELLVVLDSEVRRRGCRKMMRTCSPPIRELCDAFDKSGCRGINHRGQ